MMGLRPQMSPSAIALLARPLVAAGCIVSECLSTWGGSEL